MTNEQLFTTLEADASPEIATMAREYPGFAANEVYNILEETTVEPARAARLRACASALLDRSENEAA